MPLSTSRVGRERSGMPATTSTLKAKSRGSKKGTCFSGNSGHIWRKSPRPTVAAFVQVNSSYSALSAHHLATKFLERFLRSKPIIDAVDASTFGAKMPRADWSFIGNMEMPVPPPDEQIQHYIAGKERLIALLEEEQRQALVHQAVTRGLDPNVQIKPSGVEWLGDIRPTIV